METSSKNFQASDATFNIFQANLAKYLNGKHAEFGLLADELTKLNAMNKKWNEAYAKITDPATKTKVTVKAKNDARKEYVAFLRLLVDKYIQPNDKITDDTRIELGLTVRDKKRTPVPPPTEIPVFEIDFSQKLVHLVYVGAADPEEKDKIYRRKPKGIQGFEVVRSIGTEPKADRDFEVVRTESKSPLRIDYDMVDKGKSVWYRVRWFNAKGDVGQWSEIKMAIIN